MKTEFDTLLKRSFAEAPEPADGGFSAAVSTRVARRERMVSLHAAIQTAALAVAAAAGAYGLWSLVTGAGPELLASAGLEVARAHGALSGAPSASLANVGQAVSAGLSQILLVLAALAGGAVAFRTAQD